MLPEIYGKVWYVFPLFGIKSSLHVAQRVWTYENVLRNWQTRNFLEIRRDNAIQARGLKRVKALYNPIQPGITQRNAYRARFWHSIAKMMILLYFWWVFDQNIITWFLFSNDAFLFLEIIYYFTWSLFLQIHYWSFALASGLWALYLFFLLDFLLISIFGNVDRPHNSLRKQFITSKIKDISGHILNIIPMTI